MVQPTQNRWQLQLDFIRFGLFHFFNVCELLDEQRPLDPIYICIEA